MEARAPGDRDRVVAQPLPQRLVHHRGDVVGEGERGPGCRSARRSGGGSGGRRRSSRRRRRRRRRGPSRASSSSASGSGRPRRAASAATRGSSSERASSSVARAGVVRRRSTAPAALHALHRVGGDERAGAGARLDHAVDLQRGDRLAHRGAADLEPLRQVALGRQPLAGRQQPHADLAGEPLGDPLVALAGLERAEIGLFYGLDHQELVRCAVLVPYAAVSSTFKPSIPAPATPGAAFDEATPADVHAAVAAATRRSAPARCAIPSARAALLRGAAARLRAAGDEIVAVAGAETGLPEARLRGELERTAGQLEAFAAVVDAGDYVEAIIDRADPDAKPIPRPDVRRMLVPIGPVAVFGASNFPLAFSTAGGDTASALAAGCPVVVKGHPSHPGTSEVVARELRAAAADAGLPEGTFAHLQSSGVEVGEALVDEPAIAAVGFTGLVRRRPRALRPRRRARRTRSRSTPRWAASTRSSSPRRRSPRAARRSPRASPRRSPTSAASCARSPASCSSRRARRATRSPPTSPRALDGAEPQVLLNERLRDALTRARRPRSPALAEAALGGAARAGGAGLPPPARAPTRRPRPTSRAQPGAARGALRPGRAAAALRLARRAARRARAHRGPAHRLAARRARRRRTRRRLVDGCSPRAPAGVVFDGFPTGVAVTHGMHHGGPYPATTAPAHTSVGMTAIRRFLRPVAFQNAPAEPCSRRAARRQPARDLAPGRRRADA